MNFTWTLFIDKISGIALFYEHSIVVKIMIFNSPFAVSVTFLSSAAWERFCPRSLTYFNVRSFGKEAITFDYISKGEI